MDHNAVVLFTTTDLPVLRERLCVAGPERPQTGGLKQICVWRWFWDGPITGLSGHVETHATPATGPRSLWHGPATISPYHHHEHDATFVHDDDRQVQCMFRPAWAPKYPSACRCHILVVDHRGCKSDDRYYDSGAPADVYGRGHRPKLHFFRMDRSTPDGGVGSPDADALCLGSPRPIQTWGPWYVGASGAPIYPRSARHGVGDCAQYRPYDPRDSGHIEGFHSPHGGTVNSPIKKNFCPPVPADLFGPLSNGLRLHAVPQTQH